MASTRRLYLLRHAHAAAARPGQGDYDRPLDAQGRADAAALGRLLVSRGTLVGQIVSSGAARARETWDCVSQAGLDPPVTVDDELYHRGEDAYRAAAARFSPADTLLVGHNPTIGDFARQVATKGDHLAVEALSRGFPTCALAILRFDEGAGLDGLFLDELLIPPFPVR